MSHALQPNRLPNGGMIDRSRPLSFRFDDKVYCGYHGDTLASALLAAGVKLVGRSFKYHRPRGVLTCGSEEPNALVELRTGARREPNTRATVVELFDGLEAVSQNCWPSLAFDVAAVNSLLSPLLVAGFYYKTFMWPAALWERLYEPAIRRAAGLGRASLEPDPDSYDKLYAFCDVLIVGGGAAGLAAAVSAARSGARVILCDEDFILGGRLNAERREIDGESSASWIHRVESELESIPDVRVLRRTIVFGAYDGGTFAALERVTDHLERPGVSQPRQRLWRIVAKRAVLATGAIERPLVFPGNDRPGVMMSSAARAYLNRFAVRTGRRAIIFTATDDGWQTAFALAAAGLSVSAIVDPRSNIAPDLLAKARAADVRTLLTAQVVQTQGWRSLDGVVVRNAQGRIERFAADLLCVSGGWNPNIALTTHQGCRPRWSSELSTFVPGDELRGLSVVGAAGGALLLADALNDGAMAGASAAESCGYRAAAAQQPRVDDEFVESAPLWSVKQGAGKAFVDFQHDVTQDDIALAVREGFRSVEHLKRYTTLGMATDQGKTSQVNAVGILADLTAEAIDGLGVTMFRPPYTPVALGAFAGHCRGRSFRPTRLTAAHRWAQEQGASFTTAGQWLRAQWFAHPTDRDWLEAVVREVQAVRSSVGVCDVSTLGKIDIQGADAGIFLDRVYANMFSTLPVGKVRYGLMLREDGFVLDDGTTARLAPDRYVMSTTTLNAAKVMQHLEYARQVLWPQLDVQIVSVTEQWAQYAVAGPNARSVVHFLFGDALDVSNAAFPYLACTELDWRGVPVRLFRVSFSGELGYELAVPARCGDAAIRAIMTAGQAWQIRPYGTEALGVMRIEKGHVAGNELNGTTTAFDLGMARMMSEKKDYIGRVLARRAALNGADRPRLVGVRSIDGKRLCAGAHFLGKRAAAALLNDQGYLTSTAYSPTVGAWIGLGLLKEGPQRCGERLRAYDAVRNADVEIEIVTPVFVDPDGSRLRA